MPVAAHAVLIGVTGPQDQHIYGPEPDDTLFVHEMKTYTQFSAGVYEVAANGHNNLASTSELKFDPSGYGDLIGKLWVWNAFPAIAKTSAATDAYYVNNLGFAALSEVGMIAGNSEILPAINFRVLKFLYDLHAPQAREDIDPDVFRYENESLLIQCSKANFTTLTPIEWCFARSYAHAFPVAAFHHQSINITTKFRSPIDFTCNAGDHTTVPVLYGTSTALKISDVQVRLYALNILLDDIERHVYHNADFIRPIEQYQYIDQVVTENAGKVVSINAGKLILNHPVKCLVVGVISDDAVAGNLRVLGGVGLKDWFNYSPGHGGESLQELKLKLNGTDAHEYDLPIKIIRARWLDAAGMRMNCHLYPIVFQPKLQDGVKSIIKTVNFSRFDKTAIEFKYNGDGAGTAFVIAPNFNVMVSSGGVGGVPFRS